MKGITNQQHALAIQTMDEAMHRSELIANPESRKVLIPLLRGWLAEVREENKQARIRMEGQATLVPELRRQLAAAVSAHADMQTQTEALNAQIVALKASEAARKARNAAKKKSKAN